MVCCGVVCCDLQNFCENMTGLRLLGLLSTEQHPRLQPGGADMSWVRGGEGWRGRGGEGCRGVKGGEGRGGRRGVERGGEGGLV